MKMVKTGLRIRNGEEYLHELIKISREPPYNHSDRDLDNNEDV